jgi:hypothetical protein
MSWLQRSRRGPGTSFHSRPCCSPSTLRLGHVGLSISQLRIELRSWHGDNISRRAGGMRVGHLRRLPPLYPLSVHQHLNTKLQSCFFFTTANQNLCNHLSYSSSSSSFLLSSLPLLLLLVLLLSAPHLLLIMLSPLFTSHLFYVLILLLLPLLPVLLSASFPKPTFLSSTTSLPPPPLASVTEPYSTRQQKHHQQSTNPCCKNTQQRGTSDCLRVCIMNFPTATNTRTDSRHNWTPPTFPIAPAEAPHLMSTSDISKEWASAAAGAKRHSRCGCVLSSLCRTRSLSLSRTQPTERARVHHGRSFASPPCARSLDSPPRHTTQDSYRSCSKR